MLDWRVELSKGLNDRIYAEIIRLEGCNSSKSKGLGLSSGTDKYYGRCAPYPRWPLREGRGMGVDV